MLIGALAHQCCRHPKRLRSRALVLETVRRIDDSSQKALGHFFINPIGTHLLEKVHQDFRSGRSGDIQNIHLPKPVIGTVMVDIDDRHFIKNVRAILENLPERLAIRASQDDERVILEPGRYERKISRIDGSLFRRNVNPELLFKSFRLDINDLIEFGIERQNEILSSRELVQHFLRLRQKRKFFRRAVSLENDLGALSLFFQKKIQSPSRAYRIPCGIFRQKDQDFSGLRNDFFKLLFLVQSHLY